MQLKLKNTVQKSEYHYAGFVELKDLADVFRDYPFEKEVLEKARIHKANMENGIPLFRTVIRTAPGTTCALQGEEIVFELEEYELRDGKSRVAAICLLDQETLEDGEAEADIFLVTPEKMDRLEKNLL